ncbi:14081_t:CDS:2 [Funneliformis geosporum]|uniref:7873_t:CDS:1 n=1 Tax=Funneliformis geosporum TaxID=1117311 RepID=A0A9W4SFB2_9GLOM|nr:7873_t:CDS:2 [Funneliformis geosporum]CAI2172319.1 14081_t:CDS:2 [Funneliformis geosporum]
MEYNSSTPSTSSENTLKFPEGNNTIPLLIIGGVAIGSMILHILLTFILKKVAKKTGWTFDNEVINNCSTPTFFIFPVASILLTLSFISTTVDASIMDPIKHALDIILILFTTWASIGFVKAASIAVSTNNDFIKSSNSVQSRKLHTQFVVTIRCIYGLIFCIGAASILLSFPRAWELGASLLASASVVALFVGLAAKPSMENLVASLQIALTQPLLLDDYIKIDGHEGIVEEIQAQYVLIKTSDERRVIIPLSRVINGCFENYTKSNENMGMNFELYVDYGIPLEDLKQYYQLILQKSDNWDHRDGTLSIKECQKTCMILKASMTAADVKIAFKLKGELREKLLEYIITTYPEYLPRSRHQNVEKRSGTDSMKRIVTKMEDAILEDTSQEISEKKHFILQEKE